MVHERSMKVKYELHSNARGRELVPKGFVSCRREFEEFQESKHKKQQDENQCLNEEKKCLLKKLAFHCI